MTWIEVAINIEFGLAILILFMALYGLNRILGLAPTKDPAGVVTDEKREGNQEAN